LSKIFNKHSGFSVRFLRDLAKLIADSPFSFIFLYSHLDLVHQGNTVTSPSPSEQTISRRSLISSTLTTLVWRLFLLIVGSGLAFGGGILWAMHNPQVVTEKPFVIKLWQYWQTNLNPRSSTSSSAATPSPETEDLIRQIQELQAQADQPGAESEAIQAQLDTLQEQLTTASVDAAASNNQLKVTLPSDFLFSPDDSILNAEAKQVLDEFLVRDLRSYEGNTVLIAASTDVEDNPQLNRELSFRRAKAIESYLSQNLNGDYRWVATGYGKSQSQDTEESLLNRRIEISVD
jgi:outer membrane protein OmpA-like peptidoglycan-associated protein